MNDLIRDTFHDQADHLDFPGIDVIGIERAGRRVRRRRRITLSAVGLATVAVVGFGATQLFGGPGTATDRSAPAVSIPDGPVWAAGSTIHLGNETVDAGRSVHAMVTTPQGIVFSDEHHGIWLTDTTTVPHQVGDTGDLLVRVRSDAGLVAWAEGTGTSATIVALDTATGSVTRTVAVARGTGEFDGPMVNGVDSGTVWFTDGDGIHAWVPGTDPELVDAGTTFTLKDVRGGRYLTSSRNSDWKGRVGPELGQGVRVGAYGVPRLSPDGSLLLGEKRSDEFSLFDTATGKILQETPSQYAYFIGYEWIDNTHYRAMGVRDIDQAEQGDATADLLTCTASACDITAPGVEFPQGGWSLPMGEDLN